MQKKIIIILILSVSIIFLSGITYSFFNSSSRMNSSNQHIAKFVFNLEKNERIELNINNINPNEERIFDFSVANNESQKKSDVTIVYQITIKTYHFIPLDIRLYEVINGENSLVGVCNEDYTRNSNNELVCNMPETEINFTNDVQKNYRLVVSFLEGYNSYQYSNLVDYINLELKSWQKI